MSRIIHTLVICDLEATPMIRVVATSDVLDQIEAEYTADPACARVEVEPNVIYDTGYKCVEKVRLSQTTMLWTWNKTAVGAGRKYVAKKK